jgi:phthalate 4,5-dioxygenase
MREFAQPEISFEPTPWGMQLTALRHMSEQLTHVRVTNALFPATFVIPLSETVTITQMHVAVDDEHTYWYTFFTSFGGPLDREAMRAQRQQFITLPDYIPKAGRHNGWGFNPEEQRSTTFLGMGEEDINVHDQWAVESMGAIQDRTREHLGTSDKVIMANRRMLLKAIEAAQTGAALPGVADPAQAPHMHGPDTVDGVAPAGEWSSWWRAQAQSKRDASPWSPTVRPEPFAKLRTGPVEGLSQTSTSPARTEGT